MTPAAPTATWRRVCEESFSRLIEDLEQQVESEVDTRVTAAIEAGVRGAIESVATESRRALAEELNQAVRRLRRAGDTDELYTALLDVTIPFCGQAVVFSIEDKTARAQCMRRPAPIAAGEATLNLPALEIPIAEAAAFATAIETRDPVIAMSTPGEVSAALVGLFGHRPDEKVYLFPLMAGGQAAGLFYAAGAVQPQPLELLSEVAALHLANLVAAGPAALQAVESHLASDDRLVTIAGSLWTKGVAAGAGAAGSSQAKEHREWWDLSREEQQMHLSAQRFARVLVAELRLARPDAVRAGHAQRDVYGVLREPLDGAREKFRERFMSTSPTMVDYLHLEMMRSLADDDANILGPDYPGPLV